MNQYEAKKFIEDNYMTWGDIKEVLRKARADKNLNWKARSILNKGISKGTSFNILWKGIQHYSNDLPISGCTCGFVGANILREFADRKIKRKVKQLPKIHHQDPIEL